MVGGPSGTGGATGAPLEGTPPAGALPKLPPDVPVTPGDDAGVVAAGAAGCAGGGAGGAAGAGALKGADGD
ncbi:hypothetical protein [Mycobacterium sp. SMC-4]|uniref:hypothetical protein n=1 Tax=Mycobacterium sp. SMC-4 TaxID=2857059 RepID=UPI0021B2407D|nr:hypothetical protein [Mycobacterium sp. SMC-4]UXA19333.1 hypothetical protein KXD98_06880 [Mycobacterium sp. SMC-4]